MPHTLCEVESHLSDSTNHTSESIQEGVSEPQHLVSEVVDTACEDTTISNKLTSTSSVFSLVLGLLHDDMPILDESIPPLEKMMAMVEEDAPPTWFHQDEDDHDLVFDTSLTTHERCSNGNIGDGASLVPLVDYFANDCFHDVDTPITMLHASANSSCHDLPIL